MTSFSKTGRISYPLFSALNGLLNNIHLMKKVYLEASKGVVDREVSRDEFINSGQLMTHVTPLEVDLLFHLSLHLNKSETMILSDFAVIAPEQYYTKVNKHILKIKAVNDKGERGLLTEVLENCYRFALGSLAGGEYVLLLSSLVPVDVLESTHVNSVHAYN